MKTWINTIIKFWWFIQGIILLVFGFLAWIPLSVTGIIVIICDYFYDHRNSTIRMSSRIMLMIYALVYMIYGGMLIAVASPDMYDSDVFSNYAYDLCFGIYDLWRYVDCRRFTGYLVCNNPDNCRIRQYYTKH